jgi:hypothetical protein
MSRYNFENNLLKASNNKDIELALTEWVIVGEDHIKDKNKICICQHKKYICDSLNNFTFGYLIYDVIYFYYKYKYIPTAGIIIY